MIEPKLPVHEKERIRALHEFDVVNTEPEKEYDDIVTLAAHICSIGTAHISLIDSHKQWIKAKIGLGTQNLDRKLAFCAHTILESDLFIVPDATKDERFHDHPMVASAEGIRFYAGMPLTTSEGYNIGSLCVIDVVPRELDENQIQALRILSKQVIKQLELRRANKILNIQSRHLHEKNEINQKLLFIIGHDVRSPLSSLKGLIDLFKSGAIAEAEMLGIISHISNTLTTADTLLHDILQWAASHQENGVEKEQIDLNELPRAILSNNAMEFNRKKNKVKNLIPTGASVSFDKNILLFVLRNLLLNANKFTEAGTISVESMQRDHSMILSVRDTGQGMNAGQLDQLFNWRKRSSGTGTRGEKGSGLALLLSQDLLKKNGADILVESREGEGSTFSIVLPA